MKTPRFRSLVSLAAPAGALLCIWGALAQQQKQTRFAPDRMDSFLYGAAFYEEYMPQDRLEKDVQLMQQAGINVVRVGESTWSVWEPEDGRFEFAWMDRIVDAPGAGAYPRHHGHAHLLDSAVDVQKASRNPGDPDGRPEGHLRHAPEHGRHQPRFSALLPSA